jgi:hypothetical protein
MEQDLERSEFFNLWRVKMESPLHKAVQAFVAATWTTSPGRFPGPQPISIERFHFGQLKRQPYLVCEKTDGVRYMLVCFEYLNKKVCALVNRAFEVHVTTLTVPRGTVLDGELVQLKTGHWRYLVYDAVLVRGEDVHTKTLTERLAAAATVTRAVIRSAKDPFDIKTKAMLPLERIRELPALDAFPYETDGLVFTPVNEPVRIGTHETMFKWKPRAHITIDFMLRDNILHVQEQGHFLRVTTMYPPSNLVNGTILECGYGATGWYVTRIRTDKTYPNNKRTYLRTIVNLQEDIQLVEFMS